jgi:hypothetical protein
LGTLFGVNPSIVSLAVAVDFDLDSAFVAAFVFFGAAFVADIFFVVFFVVAVDALLDAAAGNWIRRVVKNVRHVAANVDEANTDEGKTLVRSTERLDAM